MRAPAAVLVLALLLLAGCSDGGGDADDGDAAGDGSSTSGTGGGGGATAGSSASSTTTGATPPAREASLSFAATGAYPVNPAFDPATASVPAGAVVHITFDNADVLPIQHNIVFEMMGSSDTIASGEQTTFDLTAPAEPGTLAYYCSIGDHRDRGMEGTLTVTA